MRLTKYSSFRSARNGVGSCANAAANTAGRRPRLTPGQRTQIVEQLQAGRSIADIAFSVGCGRDQVYRVRAALAAGQETLS